jgi:hypothetical protein
MALDEKLIKLAHRARKLHEVWVRAPDSPEGKLAYEQLTILLTRDHKTFGDLAELIHISKLAEAGAPPEDDVSPSTSADDPLQDVFALVERALRWFLLLKDHQYVALTLWILHSFVFREFDHSPRLAVLSPVRGCGKSNVAIIGERLCLRAKRFGSVTTAVLPRLTDEHYCVLGDETDNWDFGDDPVLRSVLNDGFTAGAKRGILIGGKVKEFELFAPVAFFAIGRLPLTLMSRSIVINMTRAPADADIVRFSAKNPEHLAALDFIYRQLFDWSLLARGKFDLDPPMPDRRFYGRVADRWRPLFSIADLLGCGERAREAAKVFAAEFTDEDSKVLLLSAARDVFGAYADDRIDRDVLLALLREHGDGLWSEFRGERGDQAPRPLTRAEMVKMFAAFGINTKPIWPRHRTAGTRRFAAITDRNLNRRG